MDLPALLRPNCNTQHKWLQMDEEVCRTYNSHDSFITARLQPVLEQELKKAGQLTFWHQWKEIIPVAIEMQERGFGQLDWDELERVEQDIRGELHEIEAKLLAACPLFDQLEREAEEWRQANEEADWAAVRVKNAQRRHPKPEEELRPTREVSRARGYQSRLRKAQERRESFFNQSNDLRWFLFDHLGLRPAPPTRDRPVRSIGDPAIRYIYDHLRVKDRPHKWVLEDLSHVIRLRTVLKMFINPLRRQPGYLREGRLYPTCKLYGAECVSGDSLIWTHLGLKTIRSIYEGSKAEKVWNGSEFQKPVKKVHFRDQEGKEVLLAHGFSIKGTNHHPVFTRNGWRELGEVGVGEEVAIYLHDGAPFQGSYTISRSIGALSSQGNRLKEIRRPERVSPELGEWVGMFLADGSLSSYHVVLSNDRPQVREHWLHLTKTIFGLEGSSSPGGDRVGQAVVSSRALVQWCLDMGLRNGARKKEIPACILSGGEAVLRGVLRGLTLDCSISAEKSRVIFGTQSPRLQKQMQVTLSGMGILADAKTKGILKLSIVERHLGLFLQSVGVLPEDKLTAALKCLTRKRKLRDPLAQGMQFAPVREVRPWRGDVYDLTMPEGTPPQYVANGILVHNTLRWSVAEPPMHSWPPRMRSSLRAAPDKTFIAVDYSQIEAGIAAILAGDEEEIREWLDPDGDLHRLMACDGLGFSRSEWDEVPDKRRGVVRGTFKSVRYNLQYGGDGTKSLGKQGCICSRPECSPENDEELERYTIKGPKLRAAVERYYRSHPKMMRWRERHIEGIRENGNSWTSPFGYRMVSCKPLDHNAIREWLNRPPQHCVAMIINRALIKLRQEGCPLVFQHHDAIYAEVWKEEVEHWRERMVAVMTEPVPELGGISFPVDVAVGETWAECK